MNSGLHSAAHRGRSRPRAVACLDILGFDQLLQERGVDEAFHRLIEPVNHSLNWITKLIPESLNLLLSDLKGAPADELLSLVGSTQVVSVSDSWLLYRDHLNRDVSPESEILILALDVAAVIGCALAAGVLLRGAIAFGICLLDSSIPAYIGKPVGEAFSFEKRQEWVGCALSSSAQVLLESNPSGSDSALRMALHQYILVKESVPVKGESNEIRTQLGLAVCWPPHAPKDWTAATVDERKRDATLRFYNQHKERRLPFLRQSQ